MEFICLWWVRDGAVEPAEFVVSRKYASLSVIPPFLQEREWLISGRNDVLKAVWADRVVEAFGGSV